MRLQTLVDLRARDERESGAQRAGQPGGAALAGDSETLRIRAARCVGDDAEPSAWNRCDQRLGWDTACRVPTAEKFGRPVAGSLATIVRSFKAAVRKEAARRLHLAQPVWQPRFHEHVIRDDEDLARVREYIIGNPSTWAEDHENRAARQPP